MKAGSEVKVNNETLKSTKSLLLDFTNPKEINEAVKEDFHQLSYTKC
jgi:hypothetical protein